MMPESDVQKRFSDPERTESAGLDVRIGPPVVGLHERRCPQELAGLDDFWVEWQQSGDPQDNAPCTRESVDFQLSRLGAQAVLAPVRGDSA